MASQAALKLIEIEAESDCRRSSRRHRALLSATLVTTTGDQPVRLRDLSSTGALIEGEILPAAGTDVVVRRGGFEAFATVAWSKGKRAGIEFDEPLSEEEVWAQVNPRLAAPPPVAMDAYRRPGFRSEKISAEQQALAREWALPAGRRAYLD